MICELFPFQKQAVNEMRLRVAMALNNYRMLKIPQVVSLQAPTGSGKTIIISALIEDIFYGSEQFTEQPEAIFVWLSDSPQLNEQSKQKIELKADKVRMDQCVVISDESFDREILEDGHKRIDDHTLVALTIMIAESRPEEKEMMIGVIMNCMGSK